ncbi:hypothetical protein ACS0TY_025866 [Phlomoides rotata]
MECGILHGIKICRDAPIVSNLFFANDTIIFRRATYSELRDGITSERGNRLSASLGVRQIDQYAVYLGIPTNVGRSMTVIFKACEESGKETERPEEQDPISTREIDTRVCTFAY